MRTMSSTEVPPPEPPKKKPPRPGPPPPPPRVGAAAAIVRAAVSATLGVPLGGVCGPIQPTWVTEPHTGKLTIQLKGAADVPSDDTATQRVLLVGDPREAVLEVEPVTRIFLRYDILTTR